MEELYRENARIVHHFLLSLCHDRELAEDLTQETFLQAHLSLERYDGSCKLSTWLCQIAKHLYYRHLAKYGREIPSEQMGGGCAETAGSVSSDAGKGGTGKSGGPDRASQPEETVIRRLELLDVLKEMQKLPQQTREVMYLRLTGELSFREIGEILGKSENWARVTFYRGKEKLIRMAREAKWEEDER